MLRNAALLVLYCVGHASAGGLFTDAITKQEGAIEQQDASVATVAQQNDDDACKEIYLKLRRGKYVGVLLEGGRRGAQRCALGGGGRRREECASRGVPFQRTRAPPLRALRSTARSLPPCVPSLRPVSRPFLSYPSLLPAGSSSARR